MPRPPPLPARVAGPVVLGWILGLATAFPPEAAGRPLPVSFHSEYQVEAWTPEDGFPENSCSGIVPAPDGYLWMTTFRGLVRFNGHEFRRWSPPQLPMLGSVSIVNVHRDPAGRTWFSTWEGLVLHERGTWRHWRNESGWGAVSNYVRSYASHPQAGIVFGRFNGDATRYVDGRFETLPPIPGRGGAFCAFDETGRLYATRAGHVVMFDGTRWQPVELDNATVSVALGIGQDRNGQARLVCRDEVITLKEGRPIARLKLSQPLRGFWELTSDPEGKLWLASLDSGVYRVSPDGTVKNLRKADGLPNAGGVRAIHVGERGNIWVGSGVGGLTSFRPARFHQLSEIDLVSDREILSLAPLPDGRILFSPTGVPLQRVDNYETAQPAAPRGPAAFPRTLLRTSDGTVWCGTFDRGLMRLENDALVPAGDEIFVGGEPVLTLFEDSRQRLWIGGTSRVAYREAGAFHRVSVPEGGERTSTFFAEQADGAILLARENLVYRHADSQMDAQPYAQLPARTRISTLLADREGRLWIGTQNRGLFVHHANTLRELTDPRLSGQQVASLHLDPQGFLWFGAGRRIARVKPDSLWQLAVDGATRPILQFFDAEDGLRSLDFPYGTQPTVAADHLGRLWFALIRGATRIDPAKLKIDATPPPVVVESIDYVPHGEDRVRVLDPTDQRVMPTLPAGSRMIRISYAALDFAAPRKQQYRVRLNDERDWQDMQGETTVAFFELPPGTHRLQIQAAGSDGAWNQRGMTFAFHLTPFYWQTAWFRFFALGGLVTLAGAGAWLVSQRRLRHVRDTLLRERRLAAAQARLALVLENTTDFVLFGDATGHILFLNRAGRTLVGLAPDAEIAGLSERAFLPTWVGDTLTRIALPAAQRDGTWTGELALRRTDSVEIPVSAVLVARQGQEGEPDFHALVARDISLTRRHAAAREALRDVATALTASLTPEKLGRRVALASRQLFQHDAFYLMLIDPRDDIARSAYMEDTPIGSDVPRTFPPVSRKLGSQMQPVLNGTPLLFNLEPNDAPVISVGPWGAADRRSTSMMFVRVSYDERTVGMISVQSYTPHRYTHEDLQQLKTLADHCGAAIARIEVEVQLRENEERLRLAMQTAHIGSWEIDLTKLELRSSPEADALYHRPLGTAPESLVATIAPPLANEFRERFHALLDGRVSDLSDTHAIALPDGTQRWLEVKARRQHSAPASASTRIIGVTADITERKQAELERSRLEEQLRQSQKLEAIGTLAGGVAHDFNNILTAVLGNVDLARGDLPPDHSVQEFLNYIRESGLRARDLVRRLLTFSRPHPVRRRPCALRPIVDEVMQLLRATIPATVQLELVQGSEAPPVSADPTEVHQALLNLGTNSWHALGNRPGWIRFRLEACTLAAGVALPHPDLKPGPYARLSIEDNGKGIPAQLLPRIFDPFFTTKAPGEGTGLGLSIVHGIMRASGGAITVASTLGSGTQFELYFPAADAAPAPAAPAPAPAKPAKFSGRILFIDDEPLLLQVAERTLAVSGFTVTACQDPADALARFEATPGNFDLVLSDFAMPGMSGLAVAEQILQRRPDIPVLIASGYLRPEDAAAAKLLGVRAVLEKIDTFNRLAAIVAEHLPK